MSNKELWESQVKKAQQEIDSQESSADLVFRAMNNSSFYIGYNNGQFKVRVDGLGYAKVRTT